MNIKYHWLHKCIYTYNKSNGNNDKHKTAAGKLILLFF